MDYKSYDKASELQIPKSGEKYNLLDFLCGIRMPYTNLNNIMADYKSALSILRDALRNIPKSGDPTIRLRNYKFRRTGFFGAFASTKILVEYF